MSDIISPQPPPTVTRAALEAYERQSCLPDVSRFLMETGRIVVAPSRADEKRGNNGTALS